MIIKKEKVAIQSYLEDNSGIRNGYAEVLYIPENNIEAKNIIRELYENNIPITFSGNGTGMTGGRIPFGGSIISTEKMKKIHLTERKTLRVEPGCTIEDVKNFLKNTNFFFPVNPTEQTATIGACASNNSSGSWSFKYGDFRKNTISLKLITKYGIELTLNKNYPVFQNNKLLLKEICNIPIIRPNYEFAPIKNAAGYYSKKDMPLIDAVIGSEGTLGFISEIELNILPKPHKVSEIVIFFKKECDALNFNFKIKTQKETIRAIEFFNEDSLSFLRKENKNLPTSAKACIILETEFPSEEKEFNFLNSIYKQAQENNALLNNIWYCDTEKQMEQIRILRHSLPSIVNEYFRQEKFIKLSSDAAVPDNKFQEFYTYALNIIKENNINYIAFGHIGNSHLHINLLTRKNELIKAKNVYKNIMKKAIELNGTISAEHGIGKLKKEYLKLMYKEKILEMKKFKNYFDPKNLFNRNNIFDSDK